MSLQTWIRRQDNPLARAAYRVARALQRGNVPVVPGLHHSLLALRNLRRSVLLPLWSKLYHEPLLRLSVRSCGPGLCVYEDMPKILGNLDVALGRAVLLSGRQVWIAAGDASQKRLTIGDSSYIGYGTEIFVGDVVEIGRFVRISDYVIMNGYDGHPLDPLSRATGDGPGPEGIGPIRIGDYAWIGRRAMILKGVTIGRGAVVAAGALVTKDVPDLTIVAGIPARTVRTIAPPPGWQAAIAAAAPGSRDNA